MALSLNHAANLRANRRALIAASMAALATGIAGCAATGGQTQVNPPTLDNIKQWLNALSPELPVFENELVTSGALSTAQAQKLNPYLDKFQRLVTQIGQLPAGADPTAILNDISAVAVALLSLYPPAAPFIPLLLTLQGLIAAYLAGRPMQSPQGQPVPPPAPPAPARLQSMHLETRAMRR